jgi:hypothetical protein
MKKNKLFTILSGILAISLGLFLGCKKESQTAELKSTFVSAKKNSFREVTSHLDAGGDFYLYLSTEQLLNGVSGKISGLRQLFASLPDAGPEEQVQIGKVIDLVTGLVKDSGVEDMSGLGVSSIATETNFYHSKAFVHHYPNRGTGFLWKLFGQQPHALTGLDMLPSNTAIATFSDLDILLLWSEIQKQVNPSGFPQAQEYLNKLPQDFERFTGLKWDQVLGSLGGEFGFVITLDDSKRIPIPLPTSERLEVPEPGLMIVAKVKDDTIFNRIDAALKQGHQQILSVDKPNLRMRTLALALPLPIQLRPTVATADGYLFIATTDAMIQEVLAVKAGQKPGLKSTDEFKRLAKEVTQQGNQFTYLSQRFGQTMVQVERQVLEMNAKTQPAQQQWLQSWLRPERAASSYCVSANMDDGWLTVGNGNQNPTTVFVVSAVALPVGMLSAIAIPNFVKARGTAQKNACINNLRQIDAAKQQWALENNKSATDVPSRDDLKPYLSRAGSGFPVCPQGGHYTIDAVGKPPACSIPGHSLSGID